MDISFLKRLGFSDKCSLVYESLLTLGPSSVRILAEKTGLNRGSCYDALKFLQEKGVVTFYNKDSRQHFVAEDPVKLSSLVKDQKKSVQKLESDLESKLPEFQALYNRGGERPVSQYFQGAEGIREVLEDVLATVAESEDRIYRVYSPLRMRPYIYERFANFTDERVEKGIHVKAIALGEGGELHGLDERKWISLPEDSDTYIFIYHGKTAYISLDAAEIPVGVIIANQGIYQIQKNLFDVLWKKI